jgi:anti-anti-sigma regulatory factor
MPPHKPFTLQRTGDQVEVSGVLDETARLVALVDDATPGGRLILDLHGVTFINSIGVREWVRLQTAAKAANVQLELRRVAEVLVHQLNIMPAARSASVVTSFYAGYLCEHCDDQHACLIDVATHMEKLARMEPPRMWCEPCKKPMTFIDPAELYFSFLAGTSPLG